jgi:hypothetical protein
MADTKSVFLTIDLEPGVEYTAIDFTTHPREAFTVSQPICFRALGRPSV